MSIALTVVHDIWNLSGVVGAWLTFSTAHKHPHVQAISTRLFRLVKSESDDES